MLHARLIPANDELVRVREFESKSLEPGVPGAIPSNVSCMVSFSAGIRKIRHIHEFLGVDCVVSPRQVQKHNLSPSAVVVWGRKQNAQRALEYARERDLPVTFVEDGWIRSSSQNAHSRICYSLLVDKVGVYYDSTVPSGLEELLNLPDNEFDVLCDESALEYSASWRRVIVDSNITKYNYCSTPKPEILKKGRQPLILVIDQTFGDASVAYGGLSQQDFHSMLDRAVAENPDARVVVRTHPDVVAGKRKGYLDGYARQRGVEISAEGDNPIPWLRQARRVYVGTSQLGYEALLCGCAVSVAGLPFYSGWGLTDDWQILPRRIRTRTLDQLFFATHIHFAQYRSPVTGACWQLHDCVEHVLVQKENFSLNAGKFVCVGITPWKRRYIAQYLRSPDGQVRFSSKNKQQSDEKGVCWSFKVGEHSNMTRIEDGFIRSTGLGSDFVAPSSLVIDDVGLYFDPGQPSRLENLLNTYQLSPTDLERACRLRHEILANNLTKYNVASNADSACSVFSGAKKGQLRVLVVGQVEDDQSILRGCGSTNTNTTLIEQVRSALSDAFIVYKPHPDVISGNRRGSVPSDTLNHCVEVVETSAAFLDCLLECDELHTMTSLSGFEALLRGKRVVVHGLPFYAGWGLTIDMMRCERRLRARSIDELLFLTLIKYPRYLDLETGEFIAPETLVERLNERPPPKNNSEFRWLRKIDNIGKALLYSA